MTRLSSLRIAAAVLLILANGVFVIGVVAERSLAGEAVATTTPSAAATTNEAGEMAVDGTTESESRDKRSEPAGAEATERDHAESAATNAAVESHVDAGAETGERVLGINPESTGLVAAVVIISLLLAAALWSWESPLLLVVVAVFSLFFAALDLREVIHQFGEVRPGLALIALVVTLLHVTVALVAGLALRRGRMNPSPTI